jgi:hypothetical protein
MLQYFLKKTSRKGTPGSLIGIGPVHSLKSDPLLRGHLVVS